MSGCGEGPPRRGSERAPAEADDIPRSFRAALSWRQEFFLMCCRLLSERTGREGLRGLPAGTCQSNPMEWAALTETPIALCLATHARLAGRYSSLTIIISPLHELLLLRASSIG